MKKLLAISLAAVVLLSACFNYTPNVAEPNVAGESTESRRVGDVEFGFITLYGEWFDFIDAGMASADIPHIGFVNLDGFIINLINHGTVAISLQEIVSMTELAGVVVDTEIGGFEAYLNVRYFGSDDIFLFTWRFVDNDNNFRMITVEGVGPAEGVAELAEIIETVFSLEY